MYDDKTRGPPVDFHARRDGSTLLANARLEGEIQLRRRRLRFVALVALAAFLTGWHFYPHWRMHAFGAIVQDLDHYRAATGRYPVSNADLQAALQRGGGSFGPTKLEFGGISLHGIGPAAYVPAADGSGFTLGFSHDCFCNPFDTTFYEYYSRDGAWDSWSD